MEMVQLVESAVGKPAQLEMVDALVAEVHENRMDISSLGAALGYAPSVQVEEGIPRAVGWYLCYIERLVGDQ